MAVTPAEVGAAAEGQLRRLLGASASALWWTGGDGDLELLASFGLPPEVLLPWRRMHASAGALPVEAFLRRRSIWTAQSEGDAASRRELRQLARRLGFGGAALLPLALDGRSLGAVLLGFPRARRATAAERAALQALVVQSAQALERAHLYQAERLARARAERAAERLSRLQQLTSALSAAATSDEVADVIFRVGMEVLGASGASLSFPAGADLVQVAHAAGRMDESGNAAEPRAGLRVLLAEAFSRQEPVWIESADALAARHPRLAAEGALRGGAWAAVPLLVRERPLGVLGIGFASPRRFDEEDRAFTVALAYQCAQAIERARLHEAESRQRAEAERSAAEREHLVGELRRTLRERDESMAVLDALFANAPVGLALLDRELRMVRVNPALAATSGLPASQLLGRTPWDVLPGLPLEPMLAGFKRVLEERQPIIDTLISGETPAAPGRLRHWLDTFYPVSVGDRVIGVGVLVREVTEQKQAEEFQRQLLGIVGHDLRSPLLAITSSAGLLQQNPSLPEREARALGRVQSAARRMDGIIRALADYTLVQLGRGMPLEAGPVDLVDVCRAVVEEAEAGNPGRAIEWDHRGPAEGEWDGDRIGQVLANLVGNALRYSPEESVVRVSCRGEGSEAVLEVHNRGRPIPAEFMPHLFEPFRRGPDPRGGDRKGLGLGLFIARQIVLAHRGTIEARSSEGEGTFFTVRLPLQWT
jgi:PAS domain S-box-containing protein